MPQTSGTDHEFAIGNAAALLDAVVRHSGVCVKILDLDGRVVMWSPGCESLYGWAADEVEGKVLPHVPAERRGSAHDLIRKVAESGAVTEVVDVAVNADGWKSNIVLTAVPVTDEDGHVCAVLTIAREALAAERDDLLRERFTAFVGQMLGEPLGTISNAAALLGRPEVAAEPERRSRLIAKIAALARESAELVEDFRVSAADTGRETLALEKCEVDLGALVAEAATSVSPAPTNLFVDFEPGVAMALADRARLMRAVSVLLRGAVASVDPGAAVHAGARRSGRAVAVRVSYKGTSPNSGSSADVFEPAAPGEGRTGPRGTWAGLHYVRAVAEAHGGRASARSEEAGEVTLTLSLPASAEGSFARRRTS